MTDQRAAWCVTVWGEEVIELSKVAAWLERIFCDPIGILDIFVQICCFMSPSPTSFLCSALLLELLWQHTGSLRCANPFDTGWIDSCWQDAPCHFVCCHLIGAPQFAFPPLFSYPRSLGPGFDIKSKVVCPFREFKTHQWHLAVEDLRDRESLNNFCHVSVHFSKQRKEPQGWQSIALV